MSENNPPNVRYVVFHTPGPNWQPGVDFREQEGVGKHVQHYANLFKDGKLEMGGPYLLEDSGGMMIATKAVTQVEVEAFAAADPTVKSGLLTYEVRAWYVAMQKEG